MYFTTISNFLSHPFIIMLFTTGIGALIGYGIQNRHWKNQFKRIRIKQKLEDTRSIYDQISPLLDKRLYASRRLLYAFKDKERKLEDKSKKMFEQYNYILYEWNNVLNRNITQIESYFGNMNRKFFENRLCADLTWVGILLRRYYFNLEGKISLEKIEQSINLTNERVYKMNKEMLKKIQELETELLL